MNNRQKQLMDVEADLAESSKVLQAEKSKRKAKGSGKLARDNAQRALNSVRKDVELLEDRVELLTNEKLQIPQEKSGSSA